MDDAAEEYKKIPPNQIQGFFKTKHRLKIGNVNDFISKLRKTDYLAKFFTKNDLSDRGIK